MIRLYADFNARTPAGECHVLMYEGSHLAEVAERLGLKAGDRVLLYQDEDDFEVESILDYRYVEYLLDKTWIAMPDWPTLRNLTSGRVTN
jgi:hypothetical protein